MPEGHLEQTSTYNSNYLNNPPQHVDKFKPQGELKIGDNAFQGQSSYVADYYNKESTQRREKAKFADNQIMPKGNFQGGSTYQGNYQG